ncbi:MAG: hypothetical protein PUB66_04015 [Oscillospiraceae bacterium]|nr:hypothetical protein [Oscillospiraceae bacterium]
MTNIEFASFIVEFIKDLGGAEQALKAVQDTPVPYKQRKVKKYLKKLIRKYIFITKQAYPMNKQEV